MSTTSANLSLTLAEDGDVVDVDQHIAANFSTLDSKWSTPGAPAAVQVGASGTPGSSTVIARSDHVHGITTGTPVSTGTANSAGSNTTVAASDHIHKTGDNSVATATIQDSAVTTAKVNDLAITAAKLAADAVTTAKILDLNVTTAKVNDLAVTAAKLAADAVTTAKIADSNVTAAKIAADAVTEAKLDCLDAPANDEVLTYDSASGRLEWQAVSALVTVGATVPSGLIAAFATAAAIASGWARYTTADGRMLVGAGTTFTVTWTENTAYGSSWAHTHTIAHSHTDSGHGHGMGASDDNQALADTGSGTNLARDVHEHTVSSGTANISGSTVADSGSTSWVIPSHAVVWAQKS